MIKNFLKETLDILERHGKTPNDVVSVQDDNFSTDWNSFANLAKGIDYDAGFGLECIATNLIILGNGWWLERRTYDGSEWWEYKTCPTPIKNRYGYSGGCLYIGADVWA